MCAKAEYGVVRSWSATPRSWTCVWRPIASSAEVGSPAGLVYSRADAAAALLQIADDADLTRTAANVAGP